MFSSIYNMAHYGIVKRRILLSCCFLSRRSFARYKKGKLIDVYKSSPNSLLTVIGSGAEGTPRSLLIESGKSRILFNCGEGLIRMSTEHYLKLPSVNHIFVTHPSWKNTSGIAYLQTYQTCTNDDFITLDVYGASKYATIFECLQQFVPVGSILNVHSLMNYDTVLVKDEENTRDLIVNSITIPKKPRLFSGEVDKCYIYECSIPSSSMITADLLVAAGVPVGPMVGQLMRGEPVTLPNGTLVKPQDVCATVKETKVLIVEIPSVNFLKSFTSHPKVQAISSDENKFPTVIVHFSCPHVMSDSRYKSWVDSFPSSVSHIVLNERSKCLGLTVPHKLQKQLHHICPQAFPLLCDMTIPVKEEEEEVNFITDYGFRGKTVQGRSLLSYNCETGFDSSRCPVIDHEDLFKHCYDKDEYVQSVHKVHSKMQQIKDECQTSIFEFPVITFLGTGSAAPSAQRNVAGILLQTSESNFIICDCGEATYWQMLLMFGHERTQYILSHLSGIYVSHLHIDHHFGLLTLIIKRKEAINDLNLPQKRLWLISPKKPLFYLRQYDCDEKKIMDGVITVNPAHLFHNSATFRSSSHFNTCNALQLQSICAILVPHCYNATAILLQLQNGCKVVYSGDCEQSDDLVKMGLNCDILIHEATFSSDLKAEARAKKHSTVRDAIEVARRMQAKHVILTHFSQRHSYMPFLREDLPDNVSIAFDFMQVRVDDLPYTACMIPALQELFSVVLRKHDDKIERNLLLNH